jgi:hypothetical protein
LWIALLCGAGCSTPRPVLDPKEGWKVLFSKEVEKVSQAIKDDYRDYIDKNLAPKHYFIDDEAIWFYEDAAGRHAVQIHIPINGRYWDYYLFYNKDNRRTDVVKHSGGRYRS